MDQPRDAPSQLDQLVFRYCRYYKGRLVHPNRATKGSTARLWHANGRERRPCRHWGRVCRYRAVECVKMASGSTQAKRMHSWPLPRRLVWRNPRHKLQNVQWRERKLCIKRHTAWWLSQQGWHNCQRIHQVGRKPRETRYRYPIPGVRKPESWQAGPHLPPGSLCNSNSISIRPVWVHCPHDWATGSPRGNGTLYFNQPNQLLPRLWRSEHHLPSRYRRRSQRRTGSGKLDDSLVWKTWQCSLTDDNSADWLRLG